MVYKVRLRRESIGKRKYYVAAIRIEYIVDRDFRHTILAQDERTTRETV